MTSSLSTFDTGGDNGGTVRPTPPGFVDQKTGTDDAVTSLTVYFVLAALIFGVLLFVAIRKAIQLQFWTFFYWEREEKADQATLSRSSAVFKAPAILAKLQRRYEEKLALNDPYGALSDSTSSGGEKINHDVKVSVTNYANQGSVYTEPESQPDMTSSAHFNETNSATDSDQRQLFIVGDMGSIQKSSSAISVDKNMDEYTDDIHISPYGYSTSSGFRNVVLLNDELNDTEEPITTPSAGWDGEDQSWKYMTTGSESGNSASYSNNAYDTSDNMVSYGTEGEDNYGKKRRFRRNPHLGMSAKSSHYITHKAVKQRDYNAEEISEG